MKVFILEDQPKRVARFQQVVDRLTSKIDLSCHRSAQSFIAAWGRDRSHVGIVSLDHDLYVEGDSDEEPGDGLMVAQFLANFSPVCPVVIHSSNADRANVMAGVLESSGWKVHRVPAVGQDWIESDWAKVVAYVLKEERRNE